MTRFEVLHISHADGDVKGLGTLERLVEDMPASSKAIGRFVLILFLPSSLEEKVYLKSDI
jgi:hypothetical protein